MAMGLGFLGRGARRTVRLALICSHLAGGVIGGAVGGALVGAIGEVSGLDSYRVVCLSIASACALLLTMRRGHRTLGLNRQVPRQPPAGLSASSGYFFWGVLLGSGVATLIPYSAFLILIGIQISAGIPLAVLCGSVYGCARSASVVLPLLRARYRGEPVGIMRLIPGLQGYATILNYGVIASGFLTVAATVMRIG